jgi:hypothetical protein
MLYRAEQEVLGRSSYPVLFHCTFSILYDAGSIEIAATKI